jgi:hypothetical protein
VRTGQVLWSDLFPFKDVLIGGYTNYLISICEHTDYGTALPLGTKAYTQVLTGLLGTVSMYSRHGYIVEKIVTDSESTFRKCEFDLGLKGIELVHTPPYQHAQRIERYVRTVKDRMRTMRCAMKVELPSKLNGMLLEAAVEVLNRMPSSKHHIATPSMLVSGSKLDLDTSILIPFGSVALLHAATRQRGGLAPRSDLGVVLGACRNTGGTYNCWNLHTEKVVRRRTITLMRIIPRPFPWPLKLNRNENESDSMDINTITSDSSERVIDAMNDELAYPIPTNDRSPDMETDSEKMEGDDP